MTRQKTLRRTNILFLLQKIYSPTSQDSYWNYDNQKRITKKELIDQFAQNLFTESRLQKAREGKQINNRHQVL